MNNDLETILDTCLYQIEEGEASLEECLARYPEHAAQLQPLLMAATKLSRASAKPSPRGSSTRCNRKCPVRANPSAISCNEGSAVSVAPRNGGRRKSLSRHGSPACRDTARPDFGDT